LIIKMGLFGIFKKKKEGVETPIEDKIIFKEDVGDDLICNYCGISIFPNQKKRTFNGKKYHLLCYRKLFKKGKNLAFN